MPAYNAGRFIAAAIGSITQQELNEPVKILVCDDASEDDTGEVVTGLAAEDRRIRLLRHDENQGVAAARNTLLGAMDDRTQYAVFFDADDVFAPAGLAHGLTRLQAQPEIMFASGRCQSVPTARLEASGPVEAHWPNISGVYLGLSVFRRELIDRIGSFDTSFSQGEDIDFLLRARELTRDFLFHEEIVYYYRRHANNLTSDMKARNAAIMRAMLLHARRRRANPALFDAKGLVQASDADEIQRSLGLRG